MDLYLEKYCGVVFHLLSATIYEKMQTYSGVYNKRQSFKLRVETAAYL